VSLCPNTKGAQCVCQPQDSRMCPYGPQPPFKPYPEDAIQTVQALIACCDAWEPSVCVMGNVRAGDAAAALRVLLAQLQVGETAPTHDDGSPAPEDHIAKCKRILRAVDDYHEAPTQATRHTLRNVIWAQLEAAAARAVAQPGWMPIETAPETGYFLVHEDGAIRALLRANGKWEKPCYPAIVSEMWESNVLVGDDAKRLLPKGYRLEARDGCCENPTHWMPLPAAPSENGLTLPEVAMEDKK
jgi:hypothetical protein